MTVIKNGYLARRTGKKKDSKQGYRTWFLVKSNGVHGYVAMTTTISLPSSFVGKKIMFKIEEYLDPVEHKEVSIKSPKYFKPVCPHEWVLCSDVRMKGTEVIKQKVYKQCLLCDKKVDGDGLE